MNPTLARHSPYRRPRPTSPLATCFLAVIGVAFSVTVVGATANVPTWTVPGPPASSSNAQSQIFVDQARDRILVVMFGGNKVRVWARPNNSTWAFFETTNDGPDVGGGSPKLVYDSLRDRLLVVCIEQNGSVWALPLTGAPTWSLIAAPGYGLLSDVSVVYDSQRDRLIGFGGLYGIQFENTVRELSLASPSAWSVVSTQGPTPAARARHFAAYDPVHDRMIISGGEAYPANLADVWALDLSPTPTWSQISTNSGGPGPRQFPTASFDVAGQRLFMFGGSAPSNQSIRLDDLWSFDLGSLSWDLLAAGGGPSPRDRSSSAFDPALGRVLMAFGYEGSLPLDNDLWAFPIGGVWQNLEPSSPWPTHRWGHSAVFDSDHGRVLIAGGFDPNFPSAVEVWALALGAEANWQQITSPGGPSGRYDHGAIRDPIGDDLYLFGGVNAGNGGTTNELWRLSLDGTPSWQLVTAAGTPPSPRSDAAVVYDPVRRRMLVIGGRAAASAFDDVWALSLTGTPTWTQLIASGVPPRFGHSAVYDPIRDRVVVFGGAIDNYDLWYTGGHNDVWAVQLGGTTSWIPLGTAACQGRIHHSAIYDPSGDRMALYGGVGWGTIYTDAWQMSFGSGTWSQLTPSNGGPGTLENAHGWYDPFSGSMVAFGGNPGTSELWMLDLGPAVSDWRASNGELPDARCRWTLTDSASPETPLLASGALQLSTSEAPEMMYYEQSGAELEAPEHWVIEARLRVVSESHNPSQPVRGVQIGFTPVANKSNFLQIGDGEMFLWSGMWVAGIPVSVNTTDALHDYRIEVFPDASIHVFYDGALVLSGSLIDGSSVASPTLWWGDGTGEASAASEWVRFAHNGGSHGCDYSPAPPSAPTDLTAIPVTCSNQMQLTWADHAVDEAGYEVEAKYSGFGDIFYEQIATLPANSTQHAAGPLQLAGLPITYRVRAVRGEDVSAYSNEATAEPGRDLNGAIAPPGGIRVRSRGDSEHLRIDVRPPLDSQSSWAGVETVEIEVSESANFSSPEVLYRTAPTGGGPLLVEFPGVAGTSYHVRARNVADCSVVSPYATFTGSVKPQRPPVVFAHGIWSNPGLWTDIWTDPLDEQQIPHAKMPFPSSQLPWNEWGPPMEAQIRAWLAADWPTHERVDIVAHSQGGLASRYMIEELGGREMVRTLVMIGTPNHGARATTLKRYVRMLLKLCAATPAVGICLGVDGAVGYYDAALNALKGDYPAMRELNFGNKKTKDDHCWDSPSESRMMSRKGDVVYRTIAGLGPSVFSCAPGFNVRSNCWFWNAKYGEDEPDGCEGDGIVSWKSVRLRAVGDPAAFVGHAHDELLVVDAASAALISSSMIRDRALSYLANPSQAQFDLMSGSLLATTEDASSDSVALLSTVSDSVSTESNLHTAHVDSCGNLVLYAEWSDSTATLEIVSPGGTTYTPADTISTPWLHYEHDDLQGFSSFIVDNPGTGTWRARVLGAPGWPTVPYTLNWIIVNGSYVLSTELDSSVVLAGEPIVIRARLLHGGAAVEASHSARITAPNGTTIDVPLHDDGIAPDTTASDGEHAGSWTGTALDGAHGLLVSGSPTSPSGAGVVRTVLLSANVVSQPDLSVASITSAPSLGTVGDPIELRALLVNLGNSPADSVTVVMFESSTNESLGVAHVSVAVGDSAIAAILWTPVLPGEHVVRAVARSTGDEITLFDNSAEAIIPVAGQAAFVSVQAPLPLHFGLGPPRPNPFSRELTLDFTVPRASHVRLEIFDVLGRRVRTLVDAEVTPGRHTQSWDGRGSTGATMKAGIYFVRLAGPGIRHTKRAVLIR